MNLILLILFLITPILARAVEGEICQNTGQVWTPFKEMQWVELDRKIAREAIRKDFKGFCEWNRMDRAAADNSYSLAEYRAIKATGDRDAAANKMGRSSTLWSTSMRGHPSLKMNARSNFVSLCEDTKLSIDCAQDIKNALSKNYSNINYSLPSYDYVDSKKEESSQKLKLKLACIAMSPKSILSCGAASSDLFEILKLRKGKYKSVTAVPLIESALSDPKITNALQKVSVHLWKRIEKKEFDKNANIFSELSEELIKDGLPVEEARKKALLILGAIATGGPNFNTRIDGSEVREFPLYCNKKPGCNMNGIYMQAIAEGMVHADTFKMLADAPAPYSLPAGSDFQCDIGKSYHFWLSAALVDRLIEQGHPPEAARAAVFASEMGYQLGGADEERGRFALSMPRYGSIENGIRMDLNLAAAGTFFGAQIKNPPSSLPLKEGLLNSIDAGNTTPYSEGDFDPSPANVLEWMNRVGASSAYDSYK